MNGAVYLESLTDNNGVQYVNVPADHPYQLVQMGFSYEEALELHQKALNQRRLKRQTGQKQGLLEQARQHIGPLQDAVDLNMATEQEIHALNAWKAYRVALHRLDPSKGKITWPDRPEWGAISSVE